MAGLGKKKMQRKAKQAQKRAAKANADNQSSSSSFSNNNNNNSDNVVIHEPDEWFAKLKEDVLDDGGLLGIVVGSLLRNTIRMTCEVHAPKFGALPLLLGKNLVFLQLLVLDPDRSIQGKLYMTGSKVDPDSPNLITCSRKFFKDAVPFVLKDTDTWFFSRSLVFKGYNGIIDEAVKFSEYDPVGDLLRPSMQPSGIRCAEVFLFVAGDFDVKEDGLCSREAVKELLRELNSKDGISKLLGFDCVAASVVVPKNKLEELKDTHLSLTA
ncbi:Histidine biosynthesis bifunctional protein HisIE [Bienertia sinuspersici]